MTIRHVYAVFFLIFLLIVFGFYSQIISSQTCSSCPDGSCPISCNTTLTGRETATSEYFYFTLTSYSDVNITMIPNSTVDYNLYVTWTPDVCPNEANKDCKPGSGTGVQEVCQYSSLPPGTYYIRVRWYNGIGKYNISISCSETTTSTTTTTTSTTSTTSTTETTSSTTTTTSTTSTTTSTTTTTTTLPTVSLQCLKNEIYVKQKNRCNVTNCGSGYWLIKNIQNKPLVNDTIQDIPPYEIEFGPAKEEGDISTTIVCTNPYKTLNQTTIVKKGPVLVCPNECYTDESCNCEVGECKRGLFLMNNHEGNPLVGDVIKDVDNIEFLYAFRPKDTGKIRVRMLCQDPYETEEEVYINVSYPVTTTTIPGEFDVSKKTCTKDEFEVSVGKNTRTEDTVLYVQLIEEPKGIIYYTGLFNVRSGFEGDKISSLTQIKDCPDGTNLKLLVLAYSSNFQRADRLKDVAFEC